ncbi:MAG: cyclic nucleotide-binding domain-containing protein [Pseudomonadota bacterium]
MPVDANSKEAESIRRLIPVSTLSLSRFTELCSQIVIEEGSIGTVLFRQGDTKKEFVYLLSGNVTLHAGGMEMDTISGGSDPSRFAIAHQLPRKVNAVASSKIRYLRIDGEFFNKPENTEKNKVSYEVSDIPEEPSGDWMTNLLKSPIFQRLPPANLQKLLMGLEEIKYPSGKIIVQQGDPGDFYYIIKEGCCALTRKPSPNAKEIRLGELRNCDSFGEDSLLSGAPRNVSVTALTDISLLRLDKTRFLTLVKEPVLSYVDYQSTVNTANDKAVFLDVRSNDEFKRRHIDNSINVPFFSLRVQINSLDRSKRYIVVCGDGNASGAAAFLLIRNAFDAVVLDGGITQALGFDGKPYSEAPPDSCSELPGNDHANMTSEVDYQPLDTEAQSENQQSRIQAEQAVERLKKELLATTKHLKIVEQERLAAKKQILDLQKGLETLKQDLANTRTISASAEESLRRKLNTLNSELAAAKDELKQRENNAKASQEKLLVLEAERERFQHADRDHAEQIKQAQAMLDEKREALSKVIAEKNALASQLKSDQETAAQRISALEKSLTESLSSQEAAEITTKSLREELQGADKSNAALEQQKKEFEDQSSARLKTLRSEKQALEHTTKELNEKFKDAEAAIRRLVSEKEALTRQNQQTKDTQAETETAFTELKSKLAALEAELDTAKKKEAKSDEAYHLLSEEHRQLNANLAASKQALEAMQAASAEVEAELANAIQAKEALAAKLTDKSETEKCLREELENRSREQVELEAQLLRQTEQSQELRSRLDTTQTEQQALQGGLDTALEKIRSEETESTRLREANDDLEKTIEALTARLEDTAATENSLREKLETLNGEIGIAKEGQQQLAQHVDDLKAEVDAERHEKETLEKALNALKQESLSDKAEAAEKLDRLDKSFAELAQTKEELASALENKTAAEQSLRAQLARTEEQFSALTDTHAAEMKEAKTQRDTLKTQLSQTDAERQTLAHRAEELEARLHAAQHEKQGLEKQIQSLKQQTSSEQADTAEKLGGLEQTLADLQHAKEKLAATLKSKTADEQVLRSQLEDAGQKLEALEETRAAELETAEARQSSLKSQIIEGDAAQQELHGQFEALKARFDATQAEKQGLEKQIEALNRQTTSEQADTAEKLGQLEQTLADLAQTKQKLASELDKQSAVQNALRAELEGARQQHQEMEQRCERSQLEAEKALKAQHDEKARVAQLEHRCNELTTIIDQGQTNTGEKTKENQQLARKLAAALEEKQSLEQAFEKLNRQVQGHSEQVQRDKTNVDRQLDQAKADYASLERELNALRQENDTLRRNVDSGDDMAARLAGAERLASSREEELLFNEQTYSRQLDDIKFLEAELKGQLAALNADNSTLKAQLEHKNSAFDELQAELATARQENPGDGGSDTGGSNDELSRKLKWLEQSKAAVDAENNGYQKRIEALGSELKALKANSAKSTDKEKLEKQLEIIRSQAKANIAAMQEKLLAAQNEAERLKQEYEKAASPSKNSQSGVPVANPGLAAVDLDVFSLSEGPSKNETPSHSDHGKRGFGFRSIVVAVISALVAIALVSGLALGTKPGRDALRSIVEAQNTGKNVDPM